MIYEYKIIYGESMDYQTEKKLNSLGSDGWELVAVQTSISGGYMTPNSTSNSYILKRVKPNDANDLKKSNSY
jgi:hypothetical protein